MWCTVRCTRAIAVCAAGRVAHLQHLGLFERLEHSRLEHVLGVGEHAVDVGGAVDRLAVEQRALHPLHVHVAPRTALDEQLQLRAGRDKRLWRGVDAVRGRLADASRAQALLGPARARCKLLQVDARRRAAALRALLQLQHALAVVREEAGQQRLLEAGAQDDHVVARLRDRLPRRRRRHGRRQRQRHHRQ
eukprot:3281266-Prymnesium_polylepis.2